MNVRHTLMAIAAGAALAAGGYTLYQVGMQRGMGPSGGGSAAAAGTPGVEDPTSSIVAG